jgi:ATP-binding cassette, subfamily C, bacterial exporter for protease/lipase
MSPAQPLAGVQQMPDAPSSQPAAQPAPRRRRFRLRSSPVGSGLWALRREFAWCGVFSFFANLLVLTSTVYMLQVYDRVLFSGSLLTLAAITMVAVLFYGMMGFADWLRSRLMVRVSARIDDALSSRTFRAAFEAVLNQPGKAPMQAFNDLTTLRQFVTGNGVFAFFDTPWVPIYIAVLFMMNPWLGWTGVAFTAVMVVLAIISHRATAALHKKAGDAGAESSAYLVSKLRNAETVEAMGMLGNLRAQWLTLHERSLARADDAQKRSRGIQTLTRFVQYAQQSLILTVGALLVLDGQIGVGAMIACNALLGNAMRPLGVLVGTWKLAIDASEAYRRLETMLDDNPERAQGLVPDTVQGQVSLRDLVATAPGRQVPILQGLNADFRTGEVIGIVGPSGAGKSTLARCLVGIWPGSQSQVLLDGTPIGEWSRESLGPHIGYLPQDIEMLDGTIAENIARFGTVDPQAVIAAAQRAGIHDMILRLPKGYDTPIGEAGGLLSGGQRQRIGLARALYGDPSLLVLDEPNANLDDLGETALIQAVRDLREQGKTVFMILHQKNLLAIADRVLVLDAGRIVQIRLPEAPPAQIEAQP